MCRLPAAAKVHMSPFPLARLPHRLVGAMLLCAGGGMQDAAAQQPPAADARFAPAAERAQQEGEKVLKRILLNGAIHKRIGPPPATEQPVAPPAPHAAKPQPAGKAAVTKPPDTPPARPALAEDMAPAAAAEPAAPATSTAAADPSPASEPAQQNAPLVVLTQVEPDFPAAIVRRQKKGSVVMRFTVQADGSVRQIEVVKTTNPFLNPAAVQALAQWKFQPPHREQLATVEMDFDLRQLSD